MTAPLTIDSAARERREARRELRDRIASLAEKLKHCRNHPSCFDPAYVRRVNDEFRALRRQARESGSEVRSYPRANGDRA